MSRGPAAGPRRAAARGEMARACGAEPVVVGGRAGGEAVAAEGVRGGRATVPRSSAVLPRPSKLAPEAWRRALSGVREDLRVEVSEPSAERRPGVACARCGIGGVSARAALAC